MERANESLVAFMQDKGAVEDRELFVKNLGWLLSQTREGLVSCELINAEQGDEHVLVTYRGGATRKINTYMDSYAAIVRDVSLRFQ